MHGLSTPNLLQVWEKGLGESPVQRALSLLEAACPDQPCAALRKLSIGRRDALLLTLREQTFGSQLESVVTCPRCDEQVELQFTVSSVRVGDPGEPEESFQLTFGKYQLEARLPNSEDLAAIAAEPEVERRRQLLFTRCLLAATRDGEQASPNDLSTEALTSVADRLTEADPQATVELNISCPACNHNWRALFDILTFFWSEIETWACRIFQEVHSLASAYGWSERDILALSPARRGLYLEMVSA